METKTQPNFDFEKLASLSEEERAAAIAEYTAAVEKNALESVEGMYKGELKNARYESAKYKMALDNTFPHFGERIAAIEEIIAQNAAFDTMSDEEKLRMAYYIDRGKSMQEAPTAEELLAKLKDNPEAMRHVEAAILERLKTEKVPALSTSGGVASVPLTPKAKPKNLSEASALAREAFGL